jgi:RimJ/RimL family protein N-acetyltransferase
MTFYNIIFGLLFIGAFREVIFALAQGPDWQLFCLTATLSVLVFSDTIYTAGVIEDKQSRYTNGMKLLDLWSFILLSFAVVILNPYTNDMFEVNVTAVLGEVVSRTGWCPEALFWGLLTLYMFNLVIWNKLLGVDRVKWCYRWVRWVQPAMLLSFAAIALVAWRATEPDATLHVVRWVVLAAVLAYLLFFKTYMSKVLDEVVTLKTLTDTDVAAIHAWTPYKAPIDVLDYALRPGGWLDQYPRSPRNVRYGIWHKGELVGFSLLTDIGNGEAEFYIALRADQTRRNLGREGTLQTIRRGFHELGLKRIHLKVRDWYGARKMYASIGFRECGNFEEQTDGKLVKFVRMELFRPR